ncbi:MAG: methylenetetrahydrofolate reductase [NAD(P)H] [bacterium]|nr:methylenetetrahydrofolate reductase [NAD(P)H] [bacterium]
MKRRLVELAELKDFFVDDPPKVSFEFFPPKTPEADARLWHTIVRLEPLRPEFVGVTYGAGGSTREFTHNIVKRIANETSLVPAAHLTCAGSSKDEVNEIARRYWEAGVRHIVALRGDPPKGSKVYVPHPQGYAYCCDLVAGLRKLADFEISVAVFPEGHPESKSLDFDMEILKRKIDAGATRAITQYFFDVDDYFRLLDRAEKHHIEIPIVPGILPITSANSLLNFSRTCGAKLPEWIVKLFDGLDDIPEIRSMLAMQLAAGQLLLLRRAGVEAFHFFTMNRSELTWALCRMLGIMTQPVSDQQVTLQSKERGLTTKDVE